jgi:ribosomal protein L10
MEKLKISAGLEGKKKLVDELAMKIKKSNTVLIASTKSLPSSQFHQIKKNLRGKAEIMVAKKSVVLRAIGKVEKGALQNLKEIIGADIALFFSDLDAFELSSLLSDNQSPSKAKPGDIALEDIHIDEGPTELVPGPAISELGAVGLKVAVEGGKLAIKEGVTVVKAGEEINSKVASVLGKLNILPMKVGFLPVAAYDSFADTLYKDIRIDKEAILDSLREAIGKGFGFAVNIEYVSGETVKYFIAKASLEEKALEKFFGTEEKSEVKIEKAEEKKEVADEGETKETEEADGNNSEKMETESNKKDKEGE